MNDKTKIILFRLGCGTALLITKALTGMDGTLAAVGIFLLGVPVEYAKASNKENSEVSEGKA